MEILNKVREWAGGLANLGVSLAALAIILEVLGLGAMPFMPSEMSVITNISMKFGKSDNIRRTL